MNRSTAKVQKEEEWWTDLRNDEVDGHFFTRKRIEDLEDWGRKLLLRFLKFSSNATAKKVDFGL